MLRALGLPSYVWTWKDFHKWGQTGGWKDSICSCAILATRDLLAGLSHRVLRLSKPVPIVRLLGFSSLRQLEQPEVFLGLENGKGLDLSFCF